MTGFPVLIIFTYLTTKITRLCVFGCFFKNGDVLIIQLARRHDAWRNWRALLNGHNHLYEHDHVPGKRGS
jgi:hypothetical protein